MSEILGPGQKEIVRQVEENVDTESDEITGHITLEADRIGVNVDEESDEVTTAVTTEATRIIDEVLGAVDLVGEDTTYLVEGQEYAEDVMDELKEAVSGLTESVTRLETAFASVATAEQVQKVLDILEQWQEDETWRDRPDLIDASFRPVLGVHTGGDDRAKSDPRVIEQALGHPIQAATIYWKTLTNPYTACDNMLNRGTLPRLELCLPHIFTSDGDSMRGTFWKRAAAGEYDGDVTWLLEQVGALDEPVLLSFSHESDLRSEDGASPKNEKPPASNYCGEYEDFPAFWERMASLARTYAPKARLFLNFSGGYEDAPKRWSTMLPTAGTYDFFGWDPYNQKYKQQGAQWDSFETRMKMFGRWDWYKETIPDVPVIIGETATCAGQEAGEDAGKWLLDTVEFMIANRWQGVGTGGGISQIHYFSHHYSAHPRCLDDAGTHSGCNSGQRYRVLEQIGSDARLAWSE